MPGVQKERGTSSDRETHNKRFFMISLTLSTTLNKLQIFQLVERERLGAV
jgi:hypothetical protein